MVLFSEEEDRIYAPSQTEDEAATHMPLEYSVAAYRFGHSMVRSSYDFNEHFSINPHDPSSKGVEFAQLFDFTGAGGFNGEVALP